MNFTSPVQLNKQAFVHTSDKLYFEGSCFSEHMYSKFNRLGFYANRSEAGVLFNPISIEQNFQATFQQEPEFNFVQHADVWFSYNHSGSVFGYSEKELQSKVLETYSKQKQAIENSSVVFITLGSAWVYVLKESGKIVANCHKQPQEKFTKKLLSVSQIQASLVRSLELLFRVDPKLAVVLTISPVKHLRDGIVENVRSKAHLITAVHEVVAQMNNVHYFPSFEIIQEELRDYRFYKADLAHPTQQAVDFVWEKFKHSFCDTELVNTLTELEKLYQAFHHKTLYPESANHKVFQESLHQKIKQLPAFINPSVWQSYL